MEMEGMSNAGTQTVSKDGIDKLIGWLTGLPFLNVMLLLLTAVIGGMGWWIVKSNTEMVERVEARYIEERKDRETQHTQQIQQITASFDRAIDRFVMRPALGANAAANPRPGG